MEKGNKVKDKTEESRERWQYLVSHFCNAEVELYPYETDSLLGKYLFKTNKIRLNKQFFDNIKVEGNKRLLNKEEILRAMWTVFHEINHAIENSSYLNLMKKRFPSLFPILREPVLCLDFYLTLF